MHSLDVIRHCSLDAFASVVKTMIASLNLYNDDFDFQPDISGGIKGISGIKGFVTCKDNGRRCFVMARRSDKEIVGIDEIRDFLDAMTFEFLNDGVYITTAHFSKELQSLVKKSDMSITLLDGCTFPTDIPVEELHKFDEKLRERNGRSKLRITFTDGITYCDTSATRTMMQAIEHIGIDLVESLDMEVCHIPLISSQIVTKYQEWQKPIGNGYYLMTQSDTEQKYRQMMSIRSQLHLNFEIEMGTEFKASSKIGVNSLKKTKKTHIRVTFEDGSVIGSGEHDNTFVQALEHIGIDKVARAHVMVSDKQLITPVKQYNNQQQISTGQWITIPNSTKDKYKHLRVIAAMTHVKLTVEIV